MEDKKRPYQFNYIEKAKNKFLEWSQENNFEIVHIDFIVPFIKTDHSLAVFFFFDANNTLRRLKKNKVNRKNRFKICRNFERP